MASCIGVAAHVVLVSKRCDLLMMPGGGRLNGWIVHKAVRGVQGLGCMAVHGCRGCSIATRLNFQRRQPTGR